MDLLRYFPYLKSLLILVMGTFLLAGCGAWTSFDQDSEEISRQKTLNRIRNQRDQARQEVRKLTEKINELEAENQQLRERLEESQRTNDELSDKINTLQEENQKFRRQRDEARQEAEGLYRRIGELEDKNQRLSNQNEERVQSLKQQNRQLESELSEVKEAQTRQEGQNLVISLQSHILFDLGEYELKPESKATLEKIAKVLGEYADRPIAVEGHTDTVPVTSESPYPSNMHLSTYRAVSVVQYLSDELGLQSDRLRAVGYGSTRPLRPNTTPENRRLNRRVELVLYPPKLDQKTVNPGE